jgi:small subunit ribosomal protein S10
MSLVKADIRLSSYDLQSLLQCCDKVEKVGLTEIGEDGELTGPIPLPNQIRRWCILKSPHVYKKSREHFSLTDHKRLYRVMINPNHVDRFGSELNKIKIPPGVHFEIL